LRCAELPSSYVCTCATPDIGEIRFCSPFPRSHFIVILTTFLLVLQGATGTVHGTVRAYPSGEPVPHAMVEVAALNRRAVADARAAGPRAGWSR
jgi:hypothetical protein